MKSTNPFRVLVRHRNFRVFWVGQTTSLIGSWMQTVGQGWLALQLTNSAFMVALVATASALPVLLLTLYGGVVADRRDKLRIVRVMQASLLMEASLLWWFTWSGHVTIVWLLVFALTEGTISAFEIPARQALIIELVVPKDLTNAIALNSGGFNLARVIGPSIAGIVIHSLGISWCFGINALSYLAVLVSLFRVSLPKREIALPTGSRVEGLREGLAYILSTREVRELMRLILVYSVLAAPYLALMPVIARNVLRSGAGGYGLLLTAVGIGGFAGALSIAAIGRRVRRGRLFEYGSYAFCALLGLFSLSRSLHLSSVLLLGVGFFMIVNNALANGLLQEIIPDALRGRVISAYVWLSVGFGPVVGPFTAGAAANRFGAAQTIGVGAMMLLAFTAWSFRTRPELRRLG
jgi:MFS family permease